MVRFCPPEKKKGEALGAASPFSASGKGDGQAFWTLLFITSVCLRIDSMWMIL